ncbi:PQQ-dependent sugar dehydrogenase [Halovenus marina]|uniref:PQQ-dependent sugar dehydrogenase n=1 Tax=Halovenus marina TaxID=3396621 RepID=UPI003F546A35
MESDESSLSRRQLLGAAGTVFIAGCLNDGSGVTNEDRVEDSYDHPRPGVEPSLEPPTDSPLTADLRVETLVENLEIPWDITFTDEEELFLTERTGTVLRFDSGSVSEVARPQDAIDAGALEPGSDERPWWVEGGEGGTLGIAAHPTEQYVYVYYTAANGDQRNRVVRYDIDASNPAETEEIIVDDIPANNRHNGGRIAFGPDDNLWICTGDAGKPDAAQDTDSLAGKILRVSPDGDPLTTNPDLGGDPRVFTYGHRNSQGIDWLPNGVPVVTEHGPSNRDEIQVLRPGDNYGWPDVRSPPGDDEYGSYPNHDDVRPPVVNTGPSSGWAPTGVTFYTGDSVPAFQNRYIVGGLISQSVYVVTLTPPDVELPSLDGESRRFDGDWTDDAYTATAHRILEDELGRVRHVTQSPSGDLYAITSNRDGRAEAPFPRERDDVLVRLTAE